MSNFRAPFLPRGKGYDIERYSPRSRRRVFVLQLVGLAAVFLIGITLAIAAGYPV